MAIGVAILICLGSSLCRHMFPLHVDEVSFLLFFYKQIQQTPIFYSTTKWEQTNKQYLLVRLLYTLKLCVLQPYCIIHSAFMTTNLPSPLNVLVSPLICILLPCHLNSYTLYIGIIDPYDFFFIIFTSLISSLLPDVLLQPPLMPVNCPNLFRLISLYFSSSSSFSSSPYRSLYLLPSFPIVPINILCLCYKCLHLSFYLVTYIPTTPLHAQ
ncbi:hypothetical protein AMTRI_Chr06g176330 [Amborella trichopoda]